MFEMEGVALEFTDNALRAVAAKAIKLQTGARGLRSILESIMLDIMYRLPSMRDQVEKCIINRAVIDDGAEPIFVSREHAKSA
jgi:ATP-dependent Clp protease ATP-binding subunit ClpX